MHIIKEAPAKILLFGEHAAVYGYPATGFALPWKIRLELETAGRMQWQLREPDGKHKEKFDALSAKLTDIFPAVKNVPPFKITVRSDVPIGVGFGSSGALCVALACGVCEYMRAVTGNPADMTTGKIWSLAHELETVFHMRPSGVDTGISAHEAICYFEQAGGRLPSCRIVRGDYPILVIGALARTDDTAMLVRRIGEEKEQNPAVAENLRALGEIAKRSAVLLEGYDQTRAENLGALANAAQEYLCRLGLSTENLNHMLKEGLKAGACGGKLSGAGSGGAYFLVAGDSRQAADLAQSLLAQARQKKIKHVLNPQALILEPIKTGH